MPLFKSSAQTKGENRTIDIHCRKNGTIEVNQVAGAAFFGYKTRFVQILPSKLSYRLDTGETVSILLAPLGLTKFSQVKDNVLLLETAIGVAKGEYRKQMTLKFESREVRESWMDALIEECDKNYFKEFVDHTTKCTDKFVMHSNREIWSRILEGEGDLKLLDSLIAAPGTEAQELMRIYVGFVFAWCKGLLGVDHLQTLHKEVFAALLQLMIDDTCARVILTSFRPDGTFLQAFKVDTARGATALNHFTDLEKRERMENNFVAHCFFKRLRESLLAPAWAEFRSFLRAAKHPAMVGRKKEGSDSLEWVEVSVDAKAELEWMNGHINEYCDVSWETLRSALGPGPFLSYHFISRKISNKFTDQDARELLRRLAKRVPPTHVDMSFVVEGVNRPLRKHLAALVDYCKFRELWKILYPSYQRSTPFHEAVHQEIWYRIVVGDDVDILTKMFLPSTVTFETATILEVLTYEFLEGVSDEMEAHLRIKRKPVAGKDVVTGKQLDNFKAVDHLRAFVMGRLVWWAYYIARGAKGSLATTRVDLEKQWTHWSAEDLKTCASVYVSLLVASFKTPAVRAVLWLTYPDMVRGSDEKHNTFPDTPLAFSQSYISHLEEMLSPTNKADRFQSFLKMCGHPLASAGAATLHWRTEVAWMSGLAYRQDWYMSLNEWSLALQDSPYLSFQLMVRRFQHNDEERAKMAAFLETFPHKTMSFFADIDYRLVAGFGANHCRRNAVHFLDYFDSRRLLEVWTLVHSYTTATSEDFSVAAQDHLLQLLYQQRENNTTDKGLQTLIVDIRQLKADDVTFVPFLSVFPHLLRMQLTGSTAMQVLFPSTRELSMEVYTQIKYFGKELKKFVEHLSKWTLDFFDCQTLTAAMAPGYVELFNACLSSTVIRTVLMLIAPLRHSASAATDPSRLQRFASDLMKHRSDSQYLYLLSLLKHEGVKQNPDGSFKEVPLSWDKESTWLFNLQHGNHHISFDADDFGHLTSPSYLLFRYISRDFKSIDLAIMHKAVDEVQGILPPRLIDVPFAAQVNYYSCTHVLGQTSMAAVTAPHFEHLLRYSLFYNMWGTLMTRLNDESLDVLFVNHIMLKVWSVVSTCSDVDTTNHLKRVFSPSKAAVRWPSEKISYLTALQRYAVLSIHQADEALLFKICHGFRPQSADVADHVACHEEVFAGHTMLMSRIIDWTKLIVNDEWKTTAPEDCAAIFVELLTASFADVAFRGFLLTFSPSLSAIAAFRKSTKCKSPSSLKESAMQFVRDLADTLRRTDWAEFRSFLSIVSHPLVDAGKRTEAELLWDKETVWFHSRLSVKAQVLTWQEFEHLMTSSPYVLLLTITKCLVDEEAQLAALRSVPTKYLNTSFVADFTSPNGGADVTTAVPVPAPHFVAMCLGDQQDVALEVFRERKMINDIFLGALLHEACKNPRVPRLLQAFNLVHSALLQDGHWNVGTLKQAPGLTSVLVKFLSERGQDNNFHRNEIILGKLIMLIFQLEASRTNLEVFNASTLLREWLLSDPTLVKMFFDMLKTLNFVEWFSRLCVKCSRYYGPMDFDAEKKEDPVVNPHMPLTKSRLSLSILGFFNICVEFKPDVFHSFVMNLGTGRPFFAYFLHSNETLKDEILGSLCRVMKFTAKRPLLLARIKARQLFYDNDHASESVIQTLALLKNPSSSQDLGDQEFTDMLTVALYTHNTLNLRNRFEEAVRSLTKNHDKSEMTATFFQWVVDQYVAKDCAREHQADNSSATERRQWRLCRKFLKDKVAFEDIIECASHATKASHLLRDNARSGGYATLERLFQHYIRNSDPTAWKELFKGSKTIAYFIKYVDVEDLNLAFQAFFDLNKHDPDNPQSPPDNNCFFSYLLKVRRLLKTPIVSGADLIKLTASASSFNEKNATKFFNRLLAKANSLPDEEFDMKFIYRVTARWMRISKDKVLFPLPPRNAQFLTLLTVTEWAKDLLVQKRTDIGKALIAQVGTGEGKSLIIAMAAIYFVRVLKKRVHILENHQGLLEKDIKTMTPLFELFGIKARPHGDASKENPDLTSTTEEALKNKDCRNQFCLYGITYCLRANMERYYSDSILQGFKKPMQNTVLIVDEVDDLIVDKNPNQALATDDCKRREFEEACEFFKTNDERPAERETNFVWELTQLHAAIGKGMVFGEHYTQTADGKLAGLDDRKNVDPSYNYALEFLQYQKLGIKPRFKSCYYYLSVPYMLQQYDCITGFSGSLGSPEERKFLAEQYKVWCFDTPSFLNTCKDRKSGALIAKVPPLLMPDREVTVDVPCVHVFASQTAQFAKVVKMCLELSKDVPVLVITEFTHEAILLRKELRVALAGQVPAGENVDTYLQLFLKYQVNTNGETTTVQDKSNWGHIVDRATSKTSEQTRFCITVTDPFGGRGHDFDVHEDSVNLKGGLAVVMTAIPPSQREWCQWKGRTARKDNRGQYAVVLCQTDNPIHKRPEVLQGFELKNGRGEVLPNVYKESLIDALLGIQDEGQGDNLRALRDDINTGIRLNRLCDAFYATYGAMKEEEWPKGHQIQLRNVLTNNHLLTEAGITRAFIKLELEEKGFDQSIPPDISRPNFWTETVDGAEWDDLAAESHRLQEAQPSAIPEEDGTEDSEGPPVGVAAPPAPTEKETSPTGTSPPPFTTPKKTSPTEVPVPDTPADHGDDVSVRHANIHGAGKLPPKANNDSFTKPREAKKGKNAAPVADDRPDSPVVIPLRTNAEPLPEPMAKVVKPEEKSEGDEFGMAAIYALRPPEAPKTPLKPVAKPSAEADFDPDEFAAVNPISPRGSAKNLATASKTVPPASLKSLMPKNEVEVDEDDEDEDADTPEDDLKIVEGDDIDLFGETVVARVVPEYVEEEEQAFDIESHNRAKAEAERLRQETEANSKSAVENIVPIGGGGGGSGVALMRMGLSAFTSGVEQMVTSGVTGTTSKDAMNLAGIAGRLSDTVKLTNFTVGETKKVVFPFKKADPLIDSLSEVQKGDPLTVGVYDISGANAGKGVSGLEVTGTIIKTSLSYSLVLECKVVGSPYSLAMYGLKRLEAKWNSVIVFDGQVTFEPAVKPNLSFVFFDAKKATAIASTGVVHFSSKNDPRSTDTNPVFPVKSVPYSGGAVHLPSDLPDCVLTVTPELRGYAKSDLKFVLFNRASISTQLQVNLSPSDMVGGEWRVILTWASTPRDLDLYCKTDFRVGTKDKPTNLVYFGKKNEGGQRNPEMGNIQLDRDVMSGNGPETITFTPDPKQKYRFFVHNYSGQSGSMNSVPISASNAKIEIVTGDGEQVFLAISPSIVIENEKYGVYWHAFDLLCGEVRLINKVVMADLCSAPW